MGGVTPKGFPYVTPTDKPKEFPTHSQSLATLLNSLYLVDRGNMTVPVVAAGANSATFNITFPPGVFSAAPSLALTTGSTRLIGGVISVSASGASVVFSNWTTAATPGPVTAWWIAAGP